MRAFIDLPDGMAIRIGAAGLLVGRHRSCDLQLVAETASRRHALLRVVGDDVELMVLGRQPVAVDGVPVPATQRLADGAELALPGLTARIRIEAGDDAAAGDYAIRLGDDRFAIRSSPFLIGGGAAHLVVAGWPPAAVALRVAQGTLFATFAEPGRHNGHEVAADTVVALVAGDQLELRDRCLAIDRVHAGDASTLAAGDQRIRGAVLEPLPRGGRVTFRFADGERRVYLPGRRYRLVAALLVPPAPHAAGDLIPDPELVPIIWHDAETGGREDLNVLLVRLRHDLVAADIAPAAIIERAPGGRATRIVVVPGCEIRELA